jgi:hypothetical protein
MTGWGVGSLVHTSPTKPQISGPSQNGPFLWGFLPVSCWLFQSPVTLAVSQADFSLLSLHPKIPFPAVGLCCLYRSATREY